MTTNIVVIVLSLDLWWHWQAVTISNVLVSKDDQQHQEKWVFAPFHMSARLYNVFVLSVF